VSDVLTGCTEIANAIVDTAVLAIVLAIVLAPVRRLWIRWSIGCCPVDRVVRFCGRCRVGCGLRLLALSGVGAVDRVVVVMVLAHRRHAPSVTSAVS
jgi:hypothetical protein